MNKIKCTISIEKLLDLSPAELAKYQAVQRIAIGNLEGFNGETIPSVEQIRALGVILRQLPQLEEVDFRFQASRLTNEEFRLFFGMFLESCPGLKVLDLGFKLRSSKVINLGSKLRSFTVEKAQVLQEILPQWQSLEEIGLVYNELGSTSEPGALEALMLGLGECKALRKLYLQCNDFRQSVNALRPLANCGLLELSLNECHLGQMGPEAFHRSFVPFIESLVTLRELGLEDNELYHVMEPGNARVFGRALSKLSALEDLELGSNNLSYRLLPIFSVLAEANSTVQSVLQRIYLVGNNILAISASGIEELSKSLTVLPLRELALGDESTVKFSADQARALGSLLSRQRKLQCLRINNIPIADWPIANLRSFFEPFRAYGVSAQQFHEVVLHDMQLGGLQEEGVSIVGDALARIPRLNKLDLYSNKLGAVKPELFSKWMNVLSRCSRLEKLIFTSNCLGEYASGENIIPEDLNDPVLMRVRAFSEFLSTHPNLQALNVSMNPLLAMPTTAMTLFSQALRTSRLRVIDIGTVGDRPGSAFPAPAPVVDRAHAFDRNRDELLNAICGMRNLEVLNLMHMNVHGLTPEAIGAFFQGLSHRGQLKKLKLFDYLADDDQINRAYLNNVNQLIKSCVHLSQLGFSKSASGTLQTNYFSFDNVASMHKQLRERFNRAVGRAITVSHTLAKCGLAPNIRQSVMCYSYGQLCGTGRMQKVDEKTITTLRRPHPVTGAVRV